MHKQKTKIIRKIQTKYFKKIFKKIIRKLKKDNNKTKQDKTKQNKKYKTKRKNFLNQLILITTHEILSLEPLSREVFITTLAYSSAFLTLNDIL